MSEASLPERRISLLASLLAASLCVLWGANTVAIKIGLASIPPLTGVGIRFLIATLLLAVIVRVRRVEVPFTMGGVLAALWPAWRGSRLRILDAIATE